MWYVGSSRPDGTQVGRFSSRGRAVPKGFLAESAYTSRRVYVNLPRPDQRGYPRIKSKSALHQRKPLGRTFLGGLVV